VVVVDYRLREGVTGIRAAKAVEAASGRPVPTIVLTGDTDPDRIVEVTRSGYAIAHKPITPEKLREMVRAAARVG
jgi:DNA-binding NtrC family response regulator